jgi:uncharacterized phage protein (TIGR01671 family)
MRESNWVLHDQIYLQTQKVTMREIKFRGKHLDNGEWVYGDYHHRAGGAHCIRAMQPDFQGKVEYVIIQVDAETVGQFTGLHDKNGKEIYEGDIVKFDNHLQGVSKVLYDSGQYTVESKNYSTALTYRIAIHAVIIGNIHDTPELLKTE